MVVVQVLLFLVLPALVLYSAKYIKLIDYISPVLVCYLLGMAMANQPWAPVNTDVSMTSCSITVALAIPLLLFSVDIPGWLRLAKRTVLSFALCMVSVLVTSSLAFFLLRDQIADGAKISGMLVGVYTGGTPNMAAIGKALGVAPETFVQLNSADILTAAVYLPVLFAIAPKVLGKILQAFPFSEPSEGQTPTEESPKEAPGMSIKDVVKALGLALLVVAAGAGLGTLFPQGLQEALTILSITTLAVAASFHPAVRRWRGSHETGLYILLCFCVAIGSTAHWEKMQESVGVILAFVSIVMFGSALLHFTLAYFFRIDRDTAIITSTAAVFGPAFIGPVASVLKNREIVVSGIASGLVGYAFGNYLGLGLAWVLSFF